MGSEDVMKDLKSVLLTLVSDPSAPMKTRAAVASALGDCTFLVSQVSHIQLRSTKVDLIQLRSTIVDQSSSFLITRFQKILFFIFGYFFSEFSILTKLLDIFEFLRQKSKIFLNILS